MKHKDVQGSTVAIIDQPWPEQDLEYVSACPMCGCDDHTLMYREVKDWSFGCAPGSWNYWSCNDCQSLYLNPRPTQNSIGRAYGSYYTHTQESVGLGLFSQFKNKLRNECLFHWLGIDTYPRLNLQSALYFKVFKPFVERKFPLDQINKLPRGSLLDVGCGNGDLMNSAKAMGFTVHGLEIDPLAVRAASDRGLSVLQGSFDRLSEYQGDFDYIVCSHVVEHAHDPRQLIHLLVNAVKPGGRVFVSWPNPQSIVLDLFGRYWRGLEAPRHLCLPAQQAFFSVLQANSVTRIETFGSGIHTIGESWQLRKGRINSAMKCINKLIYSASSLMPSTKRQDFLTICYQAPSNSSNESINGLM